MSECKLYLSSFAASAVCPLPISLSIWSCCCCLLLGRHHNALDMLTYSALEVHVANILCSHPWSTVMQLIQHDEQN